jgi:hypothetical protein
MAVKRPFGKDDPSRFIDGALRGGSGSSNEVQEMGCDRPDQKIVTSFGLDNVGKVYGRDASSMKDKGGFAGSPENLKHSLSGASAVQEELGAAGKLKHVIIPNH